jgi:hypothetical protein
MKTPVVSTEGPEGPSGETFSLRLAAYRGEKVSPCGPFGALVETTVLHAPIALRHLVRAWRLALA